MSGTALAGRPVLERGYLSGAGLLLDQLRYAVIDLWRSRVVLIFTLAIPLVWLAVIGVMAGNAVVDESTGLRVMQFATPTAVAMGAFFAAFPTVAISLAEAREHGVLKRIRGTPLPAWIYVGGRIGGAVVFAVISVGAALAVGVIAYDLQIVWNTALATITTLVVGLACFAAIGLAFAALAPSASVAEAGSIGSAVALSFVSGVFTIGGELPSWMLTIASFFPLKPFTEALQDQFNPYLSGVGWDLEALAVLVAWGMVAAVVAARAFRWEPRRAHAASVRSRPASPTAAGVLRVSSGRRPSGMAMVRDQVRAANRSIWRDPGAVFFAVVMPVGLYALMLSTQGDGTGPGDVPLNIVLAASMVTWGAAVTAFTNLPQSVATARDRGVLKRLRGTPLSPGQYVAGRTVAALGLAVLIAALIGAVGVLFYGLGLSVAGTVVGLAALLVGTLSLAGCGFMLAALLPNARAVGAAGLVVLLPLAFFSDIFNTSGPEWMSTVGSLFPLKHLQNALVQAWDPAGASFAWSDLGVLILWAVIATAVALRFFRWDTRPGR